MSFYHLIKFSLNKSTQEALYAMSFVCFIAMRSLRYRRRVSKARAFCSSNAEEFCKNTTLHGLKYIVEKDLNVFEKTFFCISLVLVVIAAAHFISNVYAKWQNTPVIVGLNAIPITQSPFPAVTICNLNQAMKSKVKHFSNQSLEFAMLQILCDLDVSSRYSNSVEDWTILEDFIVNVSQPCEQMLLSCRFGAVEYNCDDIFEPVMTDEGLCCTFNMVHPSFLYLHLFPEDDMPLYTPVLEPVDWNAEKGYPKVLPPRFYPQVVAGTGESLGLTLILNVDLDEYYCSSASGPGFKILLHSPTETPQMRETGLLLQAGYETKMRINAVKSEAGKGLRGIRREYRHCIFNNELKLIHYRFYTRRNCEIECNAKLMVKHCNCVAHFLPRFFPNVSRCGVKEKKCLDSVLERSHVVDLKETDCHDICLPSCSDLTFQPDFFVSPISHDGFFIKNKLVQNMSNEYATKNIAVAHMYFKEHTFRGSVKTQFIGITDFLSNSGGLMSLFLGFSFISLTELAYYALIRPLRRFLYRRFHKARIATDDLQPRPQQTRRMVDYTSNKREYNYRSRLMPLLMSNKIVEKQQYFIGTISQSLMKEFKTPSPVLPPP